MLFTLCSLIVNAPRRYVLTIRRYVLLISIDEKTQGKNIEQWHLVEKYGTKWG
jgi:hypothetical protein